MKFMTHKIHRGADLENGYVVVRSRGVYDFSDIIFPGDLRNRITSYNVCYTKLLRDYDGRVSINFGVYAAPESFLVDPSGEVVYKQIGALTPDVVEEVIMPMVREMRGGGT